MTPVEKDAQKVIQLVAERCSLDLDVLLGNIRTQRVAQVRWVAMHLLNQLLHMSLPAIGKALNRHHTSVMVGLRRVDAQIVADAVYAERLAEVVKEISNEVLGGVR